MVGFIGRCPLELWGVGFFIAAYVEIAWKLQSFTMYVELVRPGVDGLPD